MKYLLNYWAVYCVQCDYTIQYPNAIAAIEAANIHSDVADHIAFVVNLEVSRAAIQDRGDQIQ